MDNGWIALAVVVGLMVVSSAILYICKKRKSSREDMINEVGQLREELGDMEDPPAEPMTAKQLQELLDDEVPRVERSSSHIVGITGSGISLEGLGDPALHERFLVGEPDVVSDFADNDVDDGLGPHSYDMTKAEDRARFHKRHPEVTEEVIARLAEDPIGNATEEQLDTFLADVAAAGDESEAPEGGNALTDEGSGPRLYQEEESGDSSSDDDSIGDRPTADG